MWRANNLGFVLPLLVTAAILLASNAVRANDTPDSRQNEWVLILVQGSGPLTPSQEVEVAVGLREQAESYLAELRKLVPQSFRGRNDINAEASASLLLEAQSIGRSLERMIASLKLVEQRPSQTVLPWFDVVEAMATETEEMADLERFRLVRSDWPRLVSILLPRIFSRILRPRVVVILERNQ